MLFTCVWIVLTLKTKEPKLNLKLILLTTEPLTKVLMVSEIFVQNTGDEPLISNVKSSWVYYPKTKKPILPGKMVKLKLNMILTE